MGELYSNEDLTLALTTTMNVIDALTEQIQCLERAVLKKAAIAKRVRTVTHGVGYRPGPRADDHVRGWEHGPVQNARQLRLVLPLCRRDTFVERKEESRQHQQERQPLSGLGLFEAAHFAVRFYPEAKRFYDRKTARTNSIVAIKAIAHKLARAVFHVLREKKPFEPRRVFG